LISVLGVGGRTSSTTGQLRDRSGHAAASNDQAETRRQRDLDGDE
jgi:hypothetical protein